MLIPNLIDLFFPKVGSSNLIPGEVKEYKNSIVLFSPSQLDKGFEIYER